MANVELLAPKILKWEGGFVDDPNDHGGPTDMGVTIETWKKVGYDKDGDGDIDVDDLKQLTVVDFQNILKNNYWNRWRANEIHNQSIADLLVDWVWGSGKWGIVIPQRLLNVQDDGLVGRITLNAVNGSDQKLLWANLFQARMTFLENIVKADWTQGRFIKGWINRLNDFSFNY